MDRGRQTRDLSDTGGRTITLYLLTLVFVLAGPIQSDVFAIGDEGPAVSSVQDGGEATSRQESLRDDKRMHRWRRTMLLGLVLLLVFAAGSYAIIRFSRNYRRYLLREPPKPTPTDDVWKMHKLPEEEDPIVPEDDEDWGDDSEFDSPDRR